MTLPIIEFPREATESERYLNKLRELTNEIYDMSETYDIDVLTINNNLTYLLHANYILNQKV